MRKSLYLVAQAGWNGVLPKPSAYPSVYTLLPAPLRQRPTKNAIQGVQAVGRLDQDTTGLLLLSDDRHFIHRMTSPKKHVPKVYEVIPEHPVDARQILKLLEGVVFDDDPTPVKAAGAEFSSTHSSAQVDLVAKDICAPSQTHAGCRG